MTEPDERHANESSPLVGSDDDHDMQHVVDVTGVEGTKSSLYLFLLTLSIGGLQIVWSVELSNGSPFLLSLGLSKALLALVWIAGPLTGTLVQPYIGICSDNCRIPWGKRKPFMIFGGVTTIVVLLALAWVQEIVGGFLGIFGADLESWGVRVTVQIVATVLMYVLDFAINTVQAGIRCFIVDNAPAQQQESANAWASRLTGLGNILGYMFGYVELPKILPFLGYTQFQVLCALASILLAVTLAISCSYIQERDPRLEGPPASKNPGIVDFFKQVFKSIRNLPPQIAKVCEVQLAAWVGWFPFLFYATTYIGQLYVNPFFEQHPDLSEDQINKAWEEATRMGTFALLVEAVVSFVASVTFPTLVVPTYKRVDSGSPEEQQSLGRRMSLSGAPFGTEQHLDTKEEGPAWMSKLQIPGLTLRRAWFFSHILFSLCMFGTFFTFSVQAGTVIVGLVGICWALTLWAPFALISAEVARIDAERRLRHQLAGSAHSTHSAGDVEGQNDENLAQAGIILGLHNVAISSPQILSSLVCSVIFKTAQKPRGVPWDDSTGWVMRFGGCAGLVAAWLTSRLTE